ncbi:hypothetical protein GCM10009601_29490 [Streptomyces thermospinosisporus]|uniref:Uncharacterized protein n=1 Tax=Streptomyces thermospinosisporus TaxID=161482 RepID=A0ABP4JLS9_9ACTN
MGLRRGSPPRGLRARPSHFGAFVPDATWGCAVAPRLGGWPPNPPRGSAPRTPTCERQSNSAAVAAFEGLVM